MFAPTQIRGDTTAQNKENAVVGSVARAGKVGLANGKGGAGAGGHPAKLAGKMPFGSPSKANILTPSNKKTNMMRERLKDITQTPGAIQRGAAPAPAPVSSRFVEQPAPKTIKRSQGLFSPHIRMASTVKLQPAENLLLLEPEYAPPRPQTPELDPMEAFGADIDISLVPMTQPSNSGARLTELPSLDLECEELVDIPVSSVAFTSRSHIPQARPLNSTTQLKCRPVPLVAHALHPTRIPRLKRKR
ncbi:hypothetical protein GGI12_001081 [Dipsacomyces acuminosporus]|nr:hypothetical protein GGI12_001081 [Dipsacomyces acuminosporus]